MSSAKRSSPGANHPMNPSEPCQFLTWDSDFFGCRIARYLDNRMNPQSWQSARTWCQTMQIDCLYLLADAHDNHTIRTAEDAGFRFVDMRLTLGRSLDSWGGSSVPPDGVIIRSWDENDLAELERIARLSFTQTRFFFDPFFSPEKSAEMYAVWIAKSCHGRAQAVLVAEIDRIAAGFITCRLESGRTLGEIELVGVSEHARGRGLGGLLVQASLNWFSNQRASAVEVVTQGRNLEAQRLYQRNGFTSKTMQLWYHKWFR